MFYLSRPSNFPSSFLVTSILSVSSPPPPALGFILTERQLDSPYVKDYDAVDPPDSWPLRFDMANWGALCAEERAAEEPPTGEQGADRGKELVGSAVIAWNTPGVDMLEGRTDLAVVWDLRVAPAWRGKGVGGRLWRQAEAWARDRGCVELKVETQNINVPACRFYQAMGCELRSIDPFAYPNLPGEVQLIWRKRI